METKKMGGKGSYLINYITRIVKIWPLLIGRRLFLPVSAL